MVDEGLGHHGRHRDGARGDVVERLPGGLDRGAVDLDHPRGGRVRWHPALVDEADRVGVDELPVPRRAGHVGAVDAGPVTHGGVEARLLLHLADQGVARVLAVVDAAPREGPQLGAGDPRRQAAQQDLDPTTALAEDDGVRRHPLSPRQGSHASNLVKYGERRVPRVPRSVARQRQDGPGHAGRRGALDRARRGQRGQPLGLRLHLPVAHPGLRLHQRLPLEVLRVGPAADEEPGLHAPGPLPPLRARAVLLPPRGGRRGRHRPAVAPAPLDDVVPHRAADVAAGDTDPQAALALPAAVGDRQPARRALDTTTR